MLPGVKAVFPFKDVAKNEARMSMFGRSRARWEGQLKDGHLPTLRLTGGRSCSDRAFLPEAAGASERSSTSRARLAKPA
jgi:hypothetical protein